MLSSPSQYGQSDFLSQQPSPSPSHHHLQQQQVQQAKAYAAFSNALPPPTPTSAQQASFQQQNKLQLLGALNGGSNGPSVGSGASSATASALLASLNGGGSSANGAGANPSSANSASLDPWSSQASTTSNSHLPLSLSQSINNPPSGVIISSAAAMGHARSETPGLPGSATSKDFPSTSLGGGTVSSAGLGSGGKLLLAAGAPQVQTSLIQPGSIPGASNQSENEKVYYLIVDLMSPTTREGALLELSKKREQWDDLALVLWHSFGVMSALLQEIVSVYPLLAPPSLTAHASNRVCNALALLQCVASHNDTRSLFLSAHIPLFLYPFLNTTSKTRPFEYLRLTSLGVIGALVKQNDNSDVINFLLSTEIIPLCLRIMETGSELSKTVAIFIVQKILLDEMGLGYICQTYERFYAVGTVLSNMVSQLVESQAVRLLKHVVRCYLRLSDNLRAREALRACLPEPLRDATFSPLLKGDMVTKRCLATLLLNLSDRVENLAS
ncbi:CCR4-NOT transcription complex subunit 9, partial [Phenoliferia sp. Uapishka_3]